MNLIKYGHSCVLIRDNETLILFDPGIYSEIPEINIDVVIITHIHADHFDLTTLQNLIRFCNPKIITNSEVAAELKQHKINAEVLEDGGVIKINTTKIEAVGNDHAIIHPSLPRFRNTGYVINNEVFHPGDALTIPKQNINVLFLPVAAPWSKLSETLDYISAVKPKICFPIHDAFLKDGGAFYRFSKDWCKQINASFVEPVLNQIYEI